MLELKFTRKKFLILLLVMFVFTLAIYFVYVEQMGFQQNTNRNIITNVVTKDNQHLKTEHVDTNVNVPNTGSQPNTNAGDQNLPSEPVDTSSTPKLDEKKSEDIPDEDKEPEDATTIDDAEHKDATKEEDEQNTTVNDSVPETNNNSEFITSSIHESTPQSEDIEAKRTAIKQAFQHAWSGYKTKAWGHDDLKPISGSSSDWVPGGIGMTVIDGLTTSWIMGLMDEFNDAKDFIGKSLNFARNKPISVFETTIRALGGLVSAYDLSGEKVFLDKAIDLADRLLPAFQSKTGVPYAQVNLKTGAKSNSWAPGGTVLSEWSTLQLEFRRLSMISGDPKYDKAVTKVMEVFDRHENADGLYPVFYSNNNDRFTTNHISFGAWGDSFYEYLIKQYLLTGKTEPKYLEMYKKSMDGMFKRLVKRSSPSNLLHIQESGGRQPTKMDHLVCFAGGMLLLGSDYTGKKARDVEAALDLTKTCHETYSRMKSGLGPETVLFQGNDFRVGVNTYLLRPETVESLFYAWRYTHDDKYRQWGWQIFQAIEKHCKTQFGYSSVKNVDRENPTKVDEMHSFFLAETLKYLYLLFSPDNLIPLDKFVFNTEAHPLKIEERI